MYQQQPPPYPSQGPLQGGYQPQGYDPEYQKMLASLRPSAKKPWILLFLVLAIAGTLGYFGWGEPKKVRAERDAGRDAVNARAELEAKVKALEAEKAELTAARDALQKSVDEKATELAELKGTYDKLQEKMKDEIAQGDIQLTHSGGRLRVDLVDKILFESGDARISKRGEGVLARVGAVLAGIEDKQIQVSGHTDNQRISGKLAAQFPTNWELSVTRATNVVRFLQDQAKVPPDRLMASGYGQHQPVASNKSPKGRARNRRIEILLTPSLAPKLISKAKLKEQQAEPAKGAPAAGAAKPR